MKIELLNSRLARNLALIVFFTLFMRSEAGHSEESEVPPVISALEWTPFLLAAKKRATTQEELSTTIHDMAKSLAMEREKASLSKIKDNQIILTSMLLYWYSTEIEPAPNTAKEAEGRQTRRLNQAMVINALKDQFGKTVSKSWKNMMSVCRTLDLPEGALP